MLISTEFVTMPRAEYLSHGEAKRQKQLLLTDTAVKLIDEAAKKRGISRSEAVERVARSSRLEDALDVFESETSKTP